MLFYLLVYLVCILYKSKNALYMLQQNLYNENNRYFKWVNKNCSKCLNIMDFLPILLAIFLFLSDKDYIIRVVYVASSLVYIISLYQEYKKNMHSENKIKFKVTTRVKRLYGTELILLGLITLIFIFLNQMGLMLIILTLIMGFLYYYIYLVNIINKPVEKLVYYYYYNKAKNKLREMDRLKIVGITGSYGKTSSKNIVSEILNSKYLTRPTPKSFNTPYGLMITINNYLDKFDEVFIAEMGAYVEGEIKGMCKFVKPKYGILTIIGDAHLKTFGSRDNICKAKFELIEGLEKNGIAVLNMDDPYQINYVKNDLKNDVEVVWIGINNKDAEFNAKNIISSKNGTSFDLIHEGHSYHFETKLLGTHNVYNILAGIALGYKMKVSINDMIGQIKTLKPVEHRLELKRVGNINMIDDAYNSNPVGANGALDVLAMMEGIKVVVTPGMVELGTDEARLNKEFGEHIGAIADHVILVGEKQTKDVKKGILESGFSEDKLIILNKVTDAYIILEKLKRDNPEKEVYALFENDLPDIYNEGGK